MTATDQDEAAEKAIRELERRVRMVCPPSLLADAYAFAAAFKRWEIDEGWYCRTQLGRRPLGSGDPPTEEFLAAKAAITRKEDHA